MTVRLRIGLNTGSVVVGRIGDDLRMDYTANSNVVHLASRMQSLAEPGAIVITEDTYRAAAGEMRAEPLGPVEVRGQREPVVVYKVTGRAPWRNRLEIRAEAGLTMLVGRQRELAQLRERLARAEAGQGQAVALVGEPGLGKSRLLYEFRRSLAGDRVSWLEGHCRARGLTLPYGPILEILRLLFRLEEGDNPFQIAEKLRQGLPELDPALVEALPFLELLFGLPGDDAALAGLQPKDKRARTQQAIANVLAAAARQRPLVLVFENLHWRDQSSEDFIAYLIGSLSRDAGLAGDDAPAGLSAALGGHAVFYANPARPAGRRRDGRRWPRGCSARTWPRICCALSPKRPTATRCSSRRSPAPWSSAIS